MFFCMVAEQDVSSAKTSERAEGFSDGVAIRQREEAGLLARLSSLAMPLVSSHQEPKSL